jgi:RNA polymerase sigma-70 factor (ECF subfamily)
VHPTTRAVDIEQEPATDPASFEGYITDAAIALRRALVARYGVELGVDAAAEAVAWAWRHRDRLAPMANPTGYLYRVGQTAVRRQTRRDQRLVDLPVEDRPGVDIEPGTDPGLHQALAELPPDQRSAVVLVHAHGYPYAEAADLLGIPVSTLKNHLHRGLSRLRSTLETTS